MKMGKNQEKEILVYADWFMYDEPKLVGRLWFSTIRGKAVYSFEYEKEWIKTPDFDTSESQFL